MERPPYPVPRIAFDHSESRAPDHSGNRCTDVTDMLTRPRLRESGPESLFGNRNESFSYAISASHDHADRCVSAQPMPLDAHVELQEIPVAENSSPRDPM
jgi:hypothetical protein